LSEDADGQTAAVRPKTAEQREGARRRTGPLAATRLLRVAELMSADADAVHRACATLPRRTTAAISELPVGTLVTLELQRPWWDRRPRLRALRVLTHRLAAIERETAVVTVVAAAIVDGGRVLIAQRSHPAALAGLWEFPGGKAERGETPAAALVREISEELGSRVIVGRELSRTALDADATLVLFAARLAADSPHPTALEHRELRWVTADELSGIDWVPSNLPFVTFVTEGL